MVSTAWVWCNAVSPLTSCTCNASSVSSSLVHTRIIGRHVAAGLVHLEWSCGAQSHTRWLDESSVTYVEVVSDANAVLGRGSHESPFEDENEGLLRLYRAPQLGRFVAAHRVIPIGTCALKATAFAVVVADREAAKYCHWCFTLLTKKAFRCGACEYALYCSHKCLEADAVLHDPQCPTLCQLKSITLTPWIDKETVRLTLAVLTMEAFVGNPNALNQLVVPSRPSPTPAQQLALDQAVQFVRRSLKKMSPPALRSIKRPHVRETIARIQTNAHPLYLNGTSGICGIGLFPEAAMTLNHSCIPNVVPSFDPTTRSLRLHAIRDIQAMELIEYSYLSDLAVGSARRQETLRDGFGVDCVCRRCVCEANGILETPGSSNEEQALLTQLMELSTETNALIVRGKLEVMVTRHMTLLTQRLDVAFSFQMLALRNATQTNDWSRVLDVAETLLRLWKAQDLPQWYPTTATLYQQIVLAATRLGNTTKAQEARAHVQECHHICGYAISEVQ